MNPVRHKTNGSVEPVPTLADTLSQEHFAPMYFARKWGISTKTVIRWFQNEPGVLKIRGMSGKRTELRIPLGIAERIYRERSA